MMTVAALRTFIAGATVAASALASSALAEKPAAVPQPGEKDSDASPAEPRDAAQIFATTCGCCHHKRGREAGKGPQLIGSSLTDGEIIYGLKMGKQGFMPAFGTAFSEEEIKALASYIRNLQPR